MEMGPLAFALWAGIQGVTLVLKGILYGDGDVFHFSIVLIFV